MFLSWYIFHVFNFFIFLNLSFVFQGATLCKGLNRGLGTLLAGVLAFLIKFIANASGRVFKGIFIGAAVFLIGELLFTSLISDIRLFNCHPSNCEGLSMVLDSE